MTVRWLWATVGLLTGCNDVIGYDELVPASQALGCVSSQQCTDDNAGVPHLCPNPGGACEPVFSEECVEVLGDFTNPNAIRIGAFLPYTLDEMIGDVKAAPQCALDLAFQEIANTVPGLPTPTGDRPISVLLCDENNNSVEAATHLRDLGVHAIVGGLAYYDVVPASTFTSSAQMLLLSTNCAELAVTSLSDNGRTWTTGPMVTTLLEGLAAFVSVLEAKYHDEHPMVPKIRVAFVGRGGGDPTETDNAAYLLEGGALRFNGGKTVAQNFADIDATWCPSGCFRMVDVTDQDSAAATAQLVAFDPHIVLLQETGTSDFLGTIVAGLESQTATQPYYVFHDDDFSPVYYLQGDGEVIPDPAVAERFFAASSGSFCSGGDVSTAFEARYAAHCPTVVPGRFQKAARMYDALYLTALAYIAHGNHAVATSELTGGALASGLAELAPGQAATEIELGPDQLPQAIATLLANGRVDARGASGPLDFDISIGSPPLTDVELACMAMGTQPPDSIGWVSSGLEWDENTWSVVGALNCPP